MEMKKYLNLEMNDMYYNKYDCIDKANEIIDKKLITGMTTRQISEEIYTHAFVYYNFKYLPEFIRNLKISKRIYNSAANGIDLEDDGDKLHRRICYSLIWNFC